MSIAQGDKEIPMNQAEDARDNAMLNWIDMVQQSPDQLPRRLPSSRMRHRNFRSLPKFTHPIFRDQLRRARRLSNMDLPPMMEFFRKVSDVATGEISQKHLQIMIFLSLVLIPSIMELGPRIDFPDHWRQTGLLRFVKRRPLSMSFPGNVCQVLIRCTLDAIIPMICIHSTANPNRFKLPPPFKGLNLEVPVNINAYAICLLPYILRLKANFCLFVADTWLVYNDHVENIADSYYTWRLIICLNHALQLTFAMELLLLMIQGLMGLWQAYRIYMMLTKSNKNKVAVFEQNAANKRKFWYKPSEDALAVYVAVRERVVVYTM
ncbi:uncharacterized protein LOC108104400 [Drosophila eugracilis]|uniref:uncharacterized protein LOC108104400 n=1 Tax=Drosophila eugracilis TaxID=29029 RepID=UPI0007E6DDCE|nr:uncharacterized protein LOC108104400 [Drosophila eugracilis]XP_017065936.1 uncharacterized protein LOC108104400 [Drosophila eugracilis]